MKLTFIRDSPHLRIFAAGVFDDLARRRKFSPGVSATNRLKIVSAALMESCWLTIASTSASNGPRVTAIRVT